MRHGYDDELPDPIRDEHGRQPGHGGSKVVADDVGRLNAESVQDPGHVHDRVPQRVGGHAVRPVRTAEPAHVRCDDPEPPSSQERDLVPPQARRIRPAVQQNHRDAASVLLDVQGDAVHLDEPSRI
jgi:hypothetical protein